MGVYNPKAHFPESCAECDLNDGVFCPYFEEDRYIAGSVLIGTKHPDCPLVEVKAPHGRLIDADAVYDAVERRYRVSSGAEHRAERDFLDLICADPTVLEAEGKDDG